MRGGTSGAARWKSSLASGSGTLGGSLHSVSLAELARLRNDLSKAAPLAPQHLVAVGIDWWRIVPIVLVRHLHDESVETPLHAAHCSRCASSAPLPLSPPSASYRTTTRS